MADIAGLFTTPEQYQMAQDQAMQAQALQFAQLTPQAQAQYGFYRGGQQLGNAIGGALGGEDPQLKLISQRQQLASQLDPTNLDTYKLVAQNAANSGDTQFAMAVADAGRQAAIQIAQANKERQLAVPARIQEIQMIPQINNAIAQYKAMPQTPEIQQQIANLESMLSVINPKPKAEATPNEIQIAEKFALEKGVKGTPEYNAEYLAQLTRLTTKDHKENIIDVGVADKTREVVYFDKDKSEQFIMKPDATGKLVRTPYFGGIDKTTAKVSATASQKGEEAGSKEIYTLWAKRLDDATKASTKALDQAGVLTQMLETPQPISGGATDFRTNALRAFKTLGLTSSKDNQALDNADAFNSLAGQHVLTFIKTLGVNPTDNDTKFAKTIGPELQKSPEANQKLINYLLNRAKEVTAEADKMEKYYTENKGSLAGYKSVFRSNVESSIKSLSDAELIKKIEEKGGKVTKPATK